MRLRTNPSEISLADLSHRLNRLLQTQFRFSSELDMRSKEDPSEREDRSQHPPSSDCFHGNVIESIDESRFAPKTMKTAAADRSIDMGSEGC